ncbi:MAG TPA: KamA family radical SAM protein [Chlamydiales bacterium]|nr:KamA family radical SAM protein [Chlamydiales bacterium]
MTVLCPEKTQAIPLWRQIQRGNFTQIEPLLEFLELSDALKKRVLKQPRFILNLPKRLAAKIAKNTLDDPILRQFVPLEEELAITPGFVTDPVQDQRFKKTKKILHKYQGRALVVATSACAMHCRYCFRQNFPYETEEKSFDNEIAYIAQDPTIAEIILSGGDPLSLSDGALVTFFRALEAIPHLKRIRFHSRFPVGIPERIDDSFLDLLENSSKQMVFIVHVNHPRELDQDVVGGLKKIQSLGIPVLNQSVLLKGVNDDEQTILSLSEELLNAGVIPYYLHALDPVQGTSHFAVSDERGLQLIRHIQENLSGFGVPRFAREEPGMPSKTFITY